MKIAFYGSSLLSSYWNGAATYYRGLLHALSRLGYEITFYEPNVYEAVLDGRHFVRRNQSRGACHAGTRHERDRRQVEHGRGR